MNALKGMGMAVLLAGALALVPAEAEAKKEVTGVVNLNTATASDLERLPGVGEKASARIIAYRKQKPFTRVEELVKVKGFGRKKLEKLRPHLAVEGPTTVKSIGGSSKAKRTKKAKAAPKTASLRKASGPPRVAAASAQGSAQADPAAALWVESEEP